MFIDYPLRWSTWWFFHMVHALFYEDFFCTRRFFYGVMFLHLDGILVQFGHLVDMFEKVSRKMNNPLKWLAYRPIENIGCFNSHFGNFLVAKKYLTNPLEASVDIM